MYAIEDRKKMIYILHVNNSIVHALNFYITLQKDNWSKINDQKYNFAYYFLDIYLPIERIL